MTGVELTGAQKSAVLLLLLDEPDAAELLRRLAPAEVRALGMAMLSVAEIEPGGIDAVLDEVRSLIEATAALGDNGAQIGRVFTAALGDRAADMLDALGPPVTARRFAALDWADAPTIAALLGRGPPQAGALLLAHLAPATAGAALGALPHAAQIDLLARLAQLQPVAPEVLADLEADVEAQLTAGVDAKPAVTLAGPDFVARLLGGANDQAKLLEGLRERDPALAAALADRLFLFADLIRIDKRGLQAVVRDVAPETLVVALKGADEALRDHVFAAMSQRAAAQLQDDLAATGRLKIAEVEAAQAEVAAVVRALAETGTVMLPGSGGGYV